MKNVIPPTLIFFGSALSLAANTFQNDSIFSNIKTSNQSKSR